MKSGYSEQALDIEVSTSHNLRSLTRGHDPRDHCSLLTTIENSQHAFLSYVVPCPWESGSNDVRESVLCTSISCLSFLICKGKVVVYLKSYRMRPVTGLSLCCGSKVDRAF